MMQCRRCKSFQVFKYYRVSPDKKFITEYDVCDKCGEKEKVLVMRDVSIEKLSEFEDDELS